MLVTDRRILLFPSAADSTTLSLTLSVISLTASRVSLPSAGANRIPKPTPTPTPTRKPPTRDGQGLLRWKLSVTDSRRSITSSYLLETLSLTSPYLSDSVSETSAARSRNVSLMALRTFGSVNSRPTLTAVRAQFCALLFLLMNDSPFAYLVDFNSNHGTRPGISVDSCRAAEGCLYAGLTL